MEVRINLNITSSNPNINRLQNNEYQVSYLHPVTKQRKRKRFNGLIRAQEYKQIITYRNKLNDLNFFEEKNIKTLCKNHLEKYPNSKLDERKIGYNSFLKEFGNYNLHELTSPVLTNWFDKIKITHNYSPKTLSHIKVNLNKLFSTLEEERIINYNPLTKVKIDKRYSPKRSRVYFSPTELKEIIALAKVWKKTNYDLDYFHSFLYTITHTGARRSEVLGLKWCDISISLKTITFRNTKTRDDRTISMSEGLYNHFLLLKRTNEYIFTNQRNKPLYMNMVQRHLKIFIKEHNLKLNWGYHALRHSFAYNYLKMGGEMYQLQAILGHHRITTTIDIYGRIKASDIENPSPYDF